MLDAQLLKNFLGGLGATGFEIRASLPDAFHGFAVVLPFPFERFGQNLIERIGRSLPMTPGVVVQLGFSLGPDGNHLHAPNLGFPPLCVNLDEEKWPGTKGFRIHATRAETDRSWRCGSLSSPRERP
jgi:hypothetical protein